ncbi:MAG: glycoside hydrolase family 5 protein [Huintestinicola sp.]
MKNIKIKKILSLLTASALALSLFTFGGSSVFAAEKKKATLTQEDFVHAEGRNIIGTDGEKLIIKGMAFGNNVWSNPQTPDLKHHTESSYKELSEMGFNCVRFYLNYQLFEDDSKPYEYKESAFKWIDKNIRWAKKYNMGIILNMHCPQGGYQSQGNGTALWTEKSNQKRLIALWKAIAKRYSDEPTIWGYGLINEPYVPKLDNMEDTTAQCKDLMERITKAIRSVSPYQAVFIEKLANAKDMTGDAPVDWTEFTVENTAFTIDDDNAVYEFHFYSPFEFTHQDAEWAGTKGQTMSYPSEGAILSADYSSYWVGCLRAEEKKASNGWAYFESNYASQEKSYNVASAAVNAANIGSGTVYFDDISVTEASPDGKSKKIFTYSFDNGTESFSGWSSDGSGEMSFCADKGRKGTGCLMISGAYGDYTAGADKFEMKKGYRYKISGYIRTEKTDSGSFPCVRLDFAKADNIRSSFDKDYLESELMPVVKFSRKNNVPIYIGEFGADNACFKDGRNGEQWVGDLIDIFVKYGFSFNYHTYHEGAFGLYSNNSDESPTKLNKALAEVFRKKLKKI